MLNEMEIRQLNMYDRMDLILSIINSIAVETTEMNGVGELKRKPEFAEFMDAANQAWLGAYKAREMRKAAGEESQFYMMSTCVIRAYNR